MTHPSTQAAVDRRVALRYKLLLALSGLLAPLLLAEVALRFAYAHYLNPFEPDDQIGYRLKPDFDGYYPWVEVHTNSHGERIPRGPRSPVDGKIVFIGDSVTFGFGELAEDTYPFAFADRIGRPHDVLNLAVPGYNLLQALGRLREALARQKPEIVLYGLCLNDIYGGAKPTSYEMMDPHFARARRGGFLSSSALLALVDRRLAAVRARFAAPPPARTHESLLSRVDLPRVAVFERRLDELRETLESAGVPLVILVFPYREQLELHPEWRGPQEYLHRHCVERGLHCLDATEVLEPHHAERLYSGASNMHFNALGHRLIADWLAEHLTTLRSAHAGLAPTANSQ